MNRFHETYDLLLTPTLPIPAFDAGHESPRREVAIAAGRNWTPFSYPLQPDPAAGGRRYPAAWTAAGLPIGLQIVGPQHDDGVVLRAAAAFERARPWPLPPMAGSAGAGPAGRRCPSRGKKAPLRLPVGLGQDFVVAALALPSRQDHGGCDHAGRDDQHDDRGQRVDVRADAQADLGEYHHRQGRTARAGERSWRSPDRRATG